MDGMGSCPPLCDPMDGSPPGSAVPGILQARMLEWVATAFSGETAYSGTGWELKLSRREAVMELTVKAL